VGRGRRPLERGATGVDRTCPVRRNGGRQVGFVLGKNSLRVFVAGILSSVVIVVVIVFIVCCARKVNVTEFKVHSFEYPIINDRGVAMKGFSYAELFS